MTFARDSAHSRPPTPQARASSRKADKASTTGGQGSWKMGRWASRAGSMSHASRATLAMSRVSICATVQSAVFSQRA